MDITALWIGYLVMASGGAMLCAVVVWLVLNLYGNSLWRKLKSAHDLTVLRNHLINLEKEGRTLIKRERNE